MPGSRVMETGSEVVVHSIVPAKLEIGRIWRSPGGLGLPDGVRAGANARDRPGHVRPSGTG